MKTAPTEILEKRAAEQRKQLHESVSELRVQVRETFDPNRAARQYFRPIAGIGGALAFVVGYAVTGIFTRC